MIEFNFGIEITLESNYDLREIITCWHRGHFKFISPRVGEEIRGFEGSLVWSVAREKRTRSDISIIFALDAIPSMIQSNAFWVEWIPSLWLFFSRVFSLLPGVSDYEIDVIVGGSFSCSSSRSAVFKRRRDLPCISFLTIRLTASFRFWREISAIKWWFCNSREEEEEERGRERESENSERNQIMPGTFTLIN